MQAWLKIYPDSAHGFVFQHHAEFAADVTEFLSARRNHRPLGMEKVTGQVHLT
jgi:hypothetical protein